MQVHIVNMPNSSNVNIRLTIGTFDNSISIHDTDRNCTFVDLPSDVVDAIVDLVTNPSHSRIVEEVTE